MRYPRVQRLSTRLRASVAVFVAITGTLHAAVPAFRPTDDSQIVLQLTSSQAESELAQLRRFTRDAPQNVEALARYTNALIVTGRRSGNERYYGYAEQAIADAPQAVQLSLQLTQAQLLQHRHEFQGAERILTAILAREPRNAEARLMRSQVRLHLHEPEQASRDCAALLPLADLLTTTTCFAQSRAALGDVSRAHALVVAVLETQSAPENTRSWSAGVAGELAARLGRNEEASNWYRLSYQLDKESHFPRIAYADWLLSQGQDKEAFEVASTGSSIADQLRTVIAQRNPKSTRAQRLQLSWAEAKANGERNHLRDQSRFELDVLHDVARAHTTALDNFRDHRETEDALLLAATTKMTRDRIALELLQTWRQERRYVDARLDSLLENT